ncbi:MAG: RcpC/CpaB family pilus assembly protein [Acidimicrobiia bacterium]|nr:RcpC/CpaB family pilus assembly protein [Acidimicrobiia bacterium]
MRPNARRLGAAVLALIFGAVGVITLVRYVQTAEDRALAGQQLVDVVVVTEPVAAGTSADQLAPLVEIRQVAASSRAPGAVTDLGSLDGLYTSVDLVPGEQLLAARFEDESARRVVGTEVEIPAGLIEVTIQVVATRAVGGQVIPGDELAVVAFFDDITPNDGSLDPASGILLRRALITNIQSSTPESLSTEEASQRRQTPATDFLVTLAVEPTETERLVFANEYGRIWLAREGDGPALDSGDLVLLDTVFEGGLGDALASRRTEDLAATDDGESQGEDTTAGEADTESTVEESTEATAEEDES